MPIEALSHVARAHKVSVTELLVGVAMFQLYRLQQKGGSKIDAPVRISVPVNMRRFFPSQTLRNFFLYAMPGIEPAYGDYTFNEILQNVHHFMRYTVNEKYLNAMMAANVMPENNMLIRMSPLRTPPIAALFCPLPQDASSSTTATLSPWWASCQERGTPTEPAPIITTSKRFMEHLLRRHPCLPVYADPR